MELMQTRVLASTAAVLLTFAASFAAPDMAFAQAGSQQQVHRYVVAPQGNEARYRVREQLAGFDLPNDAIGRTSSVTGGLVMTASGDIIAEGTGFTIDMTSLATDSDRRDNYVRRNTLQTEAHPNVVFVPTSFSGLPFPLPSSGEVTFTMTGDLTVRGITRPATWDVVATIADGAIRGEAKTAFTFEQFEMTKPRVRSVLSVDDDIRLEYTFFLVPAR